jgi:hypothetical protein
MRGRYEAALAEVEEMKRTLREHAQRVAAREKELEQLRLDVAGRQGRRRTTAPTAPAGPDRSQELAHAIEEAEKRERQAVQELALAKAERERLEEREQAIRKVERELAGLRMQLQEEKARLSGSAPREPEPARDPEPEGHPPRCLNRRPTRISSRRRPGSLGAAACSRTRSSKNSARARQPRCYRRRWLVACARGALLRRAPCHVYVCELSRPARPRPAAYAPQAAPAVA